LINANLLINDCTGRNSGLRSLKDGLVGHWPLTEVAEVGGKSGDISGSGLDLTISGASYTTDRHARADAALSFDGLTDYLAVADNAILDLEDALTLATWVQWDGVADTGAHRGVVKGNKVYGFRIYGSSHLTYPNVVMASLDNPDGGGGKSVRSSGGLPTNGTWAHVCMTYDKLLGSDNLKLYIDGVLDDSDDYNSSLTSDDDDFRVSFGVSSICMNGKVADVRLYNRALTPAEVFSLTLQG